MAIGDTWTASMGTGTVTRQPSAGVAEQVSYMIKENTTDGMGMSNGSVVKGIFSGAYKTDVDIVDATQTGAQPFNMAILIDNTNFLRKDGTTDVIYTGGVQVDA